MDRILYNMRFRRGIDTTLFNYIDVNGKITGSSLLSNYSYHDIDIALLCDEQTITTFDTHLLSCGNSAVVSYIENTAYHKKVTDTAQYIFDLLLKGEYCLYRKDNYRDSTFISCYARREGVLYNLLLMDEINVFAEWCYATEQLIIHQHDIKLHDKYQRIKFFESHRKDFRRTLKCEHMN